MPRRPSRQNLAQRLRKSINYIKVNTLFTKNICKEGILRPNAHGCLAMWARSFGKTVRGAHLYNNFIQATNALSQIIDKHLE
jgi:hypothetical protein